MKARGSMIGPQGWAFLAAVVVGALAGGAAAAIVVVEFMCRANT